MRAILTTALLLSTTLVATADTKHDDFAFELQEYTGSYSRAWVLSKLTTFEVGPKCWEKLVDDKFSALHTASFYTPHVLAYAKRATGDDWDRIETQNNNDRENNKLLVAPMMDAFRSRFHVRIVVEGDDCNADHGSLWLRYWSSIGEALESFPAQPKLAITLRVTPKVKTVTSKVGKGTFEFVAPRDIEPKGWDEALEKPFRKFAKEGR